MKGFTMASLAIGLLASAMTCSAQSIDGKIEEHDYVDLGLPSGMKWATCNIGATKSSDLGEFYAWGEKKPRKVYDIDNHKWAIYDFERKVDKYIKYNKKDGLWTLEPKDDVAKAKFGKSWFLPTKEDTEELLEGCTWEWVNNYNNSGKEGALGTSKKNGHTIFLPASGNMERDAKHFKKSIVLLWTSILEEEKDYNRDSKNSYILDMYNNKDGVVVATLYGYPRFLGVNCRAVTK
ncbi:MAG: hypothetical protein MJY63_01420 [Paludibacteraceae bacterium]|nr:hypothetical protein [Paludibacteraceae bacterium]